MLVAGGAPDGWSIIMMPVRVRLKQSSATNPGLFAASSMCCQHVRYANRSGWPPFRKKDGVKKKTHAIYTKNIINAPTVVLMRTVEYVSGMVALVSMGPVCPSVM